MPTNIKKYANAGYPAVAIATSDEDRSIAMALAQLDPSRDHSRPAWRIAASGGILDANTGRCIESVGPPSPGAPPPGTYASALHRMTKQKNPGGILIMLDFHKIIQNAAAYRMLRDALISIKAHGGMVVLVAPNWQMPKELEHDIPVIHDSLPSRQELESALNVVVRATACNVKDEPTRQALLDGASGLTLAEAEGAFALSYDSKDGSHGYDPAIVSEEKMKLVRQSGMLEVSPPAKIGDLGGLGALKEYITNEIVPTIHEPDLRVRGVMLVGVPGGGKSLSSRVMGAILGWPVLAANIGKLKGSLQGESEGNMYSMLRLAEAVSPCVLRLDEVEKGIGGHASSSQTDGGVTLGMIGILLTWLEEHNFPIVTIGTCNDFSKLPAEFSRAGRFDERFFVDIPTASERLEIAQVHLGKFSVNGDCPQRAADLSEGWTGAEIAQLVRSAARRTRRKITPESLTECAVDIKPLSEVRRDEIQALRDSGRANFRLANTPEALTALPTGRRVTARAK